MNAPETALPGKHTGAAGQLYMAFELSDRKWLLVVSDGARGPSRYTVDAGDQRAVLDAIAKAKARCGLVGDVVVRSCYEAGRDGFWRLSSRGAGSRKRRGQCGVCLFRQNQVLCVRA